MIAVDTSTWVGFCKVMPARTLSSSTGRYRTDKC